MINDQEYITTELKKTLEKMIILSAPRLNVFYTYEGNQIITKKSAIKIW